MCCARKKKKGGKGEKGRGGGVCFFCLIFNFSIVVRRTHPIHFLYPKHIKNNIYIYLYIFLE